MKIKYHVWICRTMIATSMLSLSGCTDDRFIYDGNDAKPSDCLLFTTILSSSESSGTRGTVSHLSIEEEEWCLDLEPESKSSTRGPLTSLLHGNEAGVIGFNYNSVDDADPVLDSEGQSNLPFLFNNDELASSGIPVKWIDITKDNLDIYAYSPKTIDGYLTVNTKNVPTLTYTVPKKIIDQKDIIASKWSNTEGTDYKNQTIPLNFSHILTGLRFNIGFKSTVKSIEVSGVYGTGTYHFDNNEWVFDTNISTNTITEEEGQQSGLSSYRIEFGDNGNGKSFERGSCLNSGDLTMIMLPQTLPSDAKLKLTYIKDNSEKILTADISGLKWRQGKLITYTLYEGQPPEVIYFDLAAGNVIINGSKYEGYRFITPGDRSVSENSGEAGASEDAGNGIKVMKISGTHNDDNNYYVFQSTALTRENIFSNEGQTFTRPSYGTVMAPDGQEWRDYIVNNSDVDAVIDAWCKGSDKYATDAGREGTENRVAVSGNLKCNLTIDNIYSTYTSYGTDGKPNPRERNTGGISFIPSGTSSILTINMIGDSRLGAVHYHNATDGNEIIFEGSGSLTVADVDGIKRSGHPGGDEFFGLEPGVERGYTSNAWASAIGGADNPGLDESKGIVINSGRIFAGTTKAENCTALGGGGNAIGIVTINGGVVTAVATTTGTAIGGGIGFKFDGGEGIVTITGGNVYAYNHANKWNIPSSAIGGAGSSWERGSKGTVKISGGSVYAVSDLGTAIGGGSSNLMYGGPAEIEITGGEIIAKTKSPISTCIGGGSSYTNGKGTVNEISEIKATVYRNNFTEEEWNTYGALGHKEGWNNTENSRGSCGIGDHFEIIGTATDGNNYTHRLIYQSTNSTGRLEGICVAHESTSPNKYNGFDGGDAKITISGNPIIRTGSVGGGGTGDINGHVGNAVINVTGGDIQAQFILAAGTKEGNVPTFEMTNGTIRNSDTSDPEYIHLQTCGGAVYMESGNVRISGGTITKCSAQFGGAVYIKGESSSSFNMTGGSIEKNSSAFDGGAVYMENGTVTLEGGTFSDNLTKAGHGGAICIYGGDLSIPQTSQISLLRNAAQEELHGDAVVGGHGGGIYISSKDGSTDKTITATVGAGTFQGNTADNKGGAMCVEIKQNDTSADVTVGFDGGGNDSPSITGNSALMQGGGLYARGENANIKILSGSISNNQVSQYVPNVDVSNELGSVELIGGNVRHNVVTLHANYGNNDTTVTQNIVTSTNSKLIEKPFDRNNYKLAGWNTQPDGSGMNYAVGATMNINKDLHLYARWAPVTQ